jgi:hypothetical protein
MLYECPRCGYDTRFNTNFKKHLSLKTICNPTKADVSLDDIKKEIFNKKEKNAHVCDGCKKAYSTGETLRVHRKKCELVKKQPDDTPTQLPKQKSAQEEEINRLKLELMYYKMRRNETYYQKFLEIILGAGHKRLKCGETDITTDEYHAEIKEWKQYKGAIGQLLCYNKHDPRNELRLYLFGSYSESKKKSAHEDCKSFNILIYNMVDNGNGTIIINNMDDNEMMTFEST